MPNKSKLVLTRPCYALSIEGNHAELTMYGEIVECQPVDWWTGEPIQGQFIILQDFLADLDSIKDAETLTIHMNSVGGDAYSAIAIHNMLRTLPAEKTAVVEGVAMSGGSLIICACEHTKAFANSLILWHHAWTYICGGFNAPDLRKLSDSLEAMDKSQTEIYMRKTGKTLEEVMNIMDAEKHLTGREAFDMGLIDELMDEVESEDLDIAISTDKRMLFVKGHQMRMTARGSLPRGIKVVEAEFAPGSEDGFDNNEPDTSGKEGGSTPMTLEELRKSDPEAAAALLAEAQASANTAVQAERQRIADIDAIASMFSDEIVNAAKYGETACTAKEMTYRAALENVKQGKNFMINNQKDIKESGAEGITSASISEDEGKPMTNVERKKAGKEAAAKLLGKKEA